MIQLIFTILAFVSPLIDAIDFNSSGIISLDFQVYNASQIVKRSLFRALVLDNQQVYYTTDIYIGSNKQRQTVLVDTGSSDLWVHDSSGVSDSAENEEFGSYNSKTSCTSVNLTTAFKIEYLDQTNAQGNWFLDTVNIAGAKLKKQQFADVITTSAGIGTLGLGFKGNEVAEEEYDNVPVTLKKQGYIKKSAYSLYLNSVSANKGTILFGGIDDAKYTGELISQPIAVSNYLALTLDSVKVNDTSYDVNQPALLDSGTSWIYLPQDIADSVAQVFNGTWIPGDGNDYYSVGCESIPGNITFTFQAGASISVPFSDLILEDAEAGCYLGLGRGEYFILGDTFLRRAYTVFDLDDETISLAQINYTEKSKIRPIV